VAGRAGHPRAGRGVVRSGSAGPMPPRDPWSKPIPSRVPAGGRRRPGGAVRSQLPRAARNLPVAPPGRLSAKSAAALDAQAKSGCRPWARTTGAGSGRRGASRWLRPGRCFRPPGGLLLAAPGRERPEVAQGVGPRRASLAVAVPRFRGSQRTGDGPRSCNGRFQRLRGKALDEVCGLLDDHFAWPVAAGDVGARGPRRPLMTPLTRAAGPVSRSGWRCFRLLESLGGAARLPWAGHSIGGAGRGGTRGPACLSLARRACALVAGARPVDGPRCRPAGR